MRACVFGMVQAQKAKLQTPAGSTMFVKDFRMGGPFAANPSVLPNTNPKMTFYTDRYQQTVVSMIIAADAVKYSLTVCVRVLLLVTEFATARPTAT